MRAQDLTRLNEPPTYRDFFVEYPFVAEAVHCFAWPEIDEAIETAMRCASDYDAQEFARIFFAFAAGCTLTTRAKLALNAMRASLPIVRVPN